MSAFLQEFKSTEDIEREYECKIPEGAYILIAWYGYGSYCGDSFVLYLLNGKLYEVNGSHCSCNGLEGQWSPEETTVAALKMRDLYRDDWYGLGEYDGSREAHAEFKRIVDALEEKKENVSAT